MARLLKPDGTESVLTPADGRSFTLEELQQAVGGYIETLQIMDGSVLVMNEGGKSMELPHNEDATNLAVWGGLRLDDHVVGNVLVCTPLEAGYED